MARLRCDISMSLDGFVAGPNPSLESPLGEGDDLLHEWAFAASSWREQHGLEGGEKSADSEVIEESIAATRAVVMGRRMFSGGEGPLWEDVPRADGWWGDEPPFHVPVFVFRLLDEIQIHLAPCSSVTVLRCSTGSGSMRSGSRPRG